MKLLISKGYSLKGDCFMNTTVNVLLRIVATFTASALAAVGAGAITGIPVWKAAVMAGVMSVANVIEALSRDFAKDGKIEGEDLNKAFNDQLEEPKEQ